MYPTWLSPPAHIDRANEEYSGGQTASGWRPRPEMPAITVPIGLHRGERTRRVCRSWPVPTTRACLFRLAYAYEQGTRHRRPPPGFPELGRPLSHRAPGRREGAEGAAMIRRVLERTFGYSEFRGTAGGRSSATWCRGGDGLVLMPTGGGKSPLLPDPRHREGKGTGVVVLAPSSR